MPEAPTCPHCGAPMRFESATQVHELGEPEPVDPPKLTQDDRDLDLPPVPLLAPGSNDDEFVGSSSGSRIMPAEPDPMLGAFITPSSGSAASMVLEKTPRPPPSEGFPAIDIGSRTGLGLVWGTAKPEPNLVSSSDDGAYEIERRGTSWGSVLLASYASAITLGLAWTLMKDRSREKLEAAANPPPSAVVAAPESPRQAGLSRKVEPPEPILGEHFATMGRPLKVGDLDVTPVDVQRRDVTLLRSASFTNPARKSGGKGALVLQLKLKNTSTDSVFAPLDQAYLRERGKGIVDTFIEAANDTRIYPFPLAVESEWSIVGQDFNELRPGESRVVAIVSAPDAPPEASGPFTWRVRLRTGIDRTDVIGLRWPAK